MSRERPLVLIPQTASAATNSGIPQRAGENIAEPYGFVSPI